MPFKARDNSPERRKVKKETSRSDKPERKERHKSSSHRKTSTRDKTTTSTSPVDSKRRSSMPSDLKEEDSLKSDSKTSLPYPNFSKAHSKEAVGARPTLNLDTPPSTDVNASKEKLHNIRPSSGMNGPPSPPLTDQNAGYSRPTIGRPVTVETIAEEEKSEIPDKIKIRLKPKISRSNGHLRGSSDSAADDGAVKLPIRNTAGSPLKKLNSNLNHSQRSVSQPTRTNSPTPTQSGTEIGTVSSSDATSIAPEQPSIQRPGSKVPPVTQSINVKKPASIVQTYSREATPLEVFVDYGSPSLCSTPASVASYSNVPPPPPPPVVPIHVPKVDYLLQYGGLNQPVPRNFLLAGKPMAIQQAVSPSQPSIVIGNLFEPYHQLLDDFDKVMSKNGSLAVATGYRSVARRLLDRLEAVFARDISCESCQCPVCRQEAPELQDVRGVSWGEVLELVSGRRDLPDWPPFSFVSSTPNPGLGLSLEFTAPMQKLDIDVPEEYREHYIRQSRKTKQSVDKWLNRQTNDQSNPPEEVDDETLTFAILTHLPFDQRSTLKKLLEIIDKPIEPPRRAPSPDADGVPRSFPTPQPRPQPEHIGVAALAIQRLYRLSTSPRDSETALFMVNNPSLHNALATLAAISNDEWDILISGRFDGFLRSGADDIPDQNFQGKQPPLRSIHNNTASTYTNGHMRHGSYSRSNTPANVSGQYGAPIAFDEETEVAALADIERDIYTGMEALEDAFEALHVKAETVRRILRERSAGLAQAAQKRRNSNVEVRLGTPGNITRDKWEAETDDGLGDWDATSELAPDDSASNISSSRRRRPKRRNERRTPALIEEDEYEDDALSEGTASPIKR